MMIAGIIAVAFLAALLVYFTVRSELQLRRKLKGFEEEEKATRRIQK